MTGNYVYAVANVVKYWQAEDNHMFTYPPPQPIDPYPSIPTLITSPIIVSPVPTCIIEKTPAPTVFIDPFGIGTTAVHLTGFSTHQVDIFFSALFVAAIVLLIALTVAYIRKDKS